MPANITCYVVSLGRLRDNLLPAEAPVVRCADENFRTLRQVFGDNSDNEIVLTVDDSRLQETHSPDLESVTAYDLHNLTARVTGNPRERAPGPLPGVALICANSLSGYPGIRGLMFDQGFQSEFEDEAPEEWKICPREGCAVFLESIANSRQPADVETQIGYTAVHELGHVFNLSHDNGNTFLRQSPDAALPPFERFKFNDTQRAHLQRCATDRGVYPGGFSFGNTGYLGGGDACEWDGKGASPLQLRISVPVSRFLPFEPVELDVTLSLIPGARMLRGLRNELDPCYDSFCVWIENPLGERRRYRSINHCCENPEPCPLTARKPFKRDLTLFGQSGGYTFCHAGHYRIWATWEIGNGRVVRSNTLDVEVLPWLRLKDRQREICGTLQAAGRPLFYRRPVASRREMKALDSLCHDISFRAAPFSVAMARYADIRIKNAAVVLRRSSGVGKKQVRETMKWLEDQEVLGSYRRKRVRELRSGMS